ncbi:MAG: hypothetical protein MJZ81_10705 [Bacteroidales bacterium]|nr:hypothetical protein [Bacteroidales bacterium]
MKKYNYIDDDFSESEAGIDEYNRLAGHGTELGGLITRVFSFNCPKFKDGLRDIFDQLLPKKECKASQEEIVKAMSDCKRFHADLKSRMFAIQDLLSGLEDMQIGLANSFRTEYDSDMLPKAHGYWARFVKGLNHWSLSGVKEEWKSDYERCVAWFGELTRGMETHNFKIICFQDCHEASLAFTVAGCPGTFEISLPLVLSTDTSARPSIGAKGEPMQVSIVWRRRMWIPVFDYFFDGFGTYHVQDAVDRIKKFVEDREWEMFCNTRSGTSTRSDGVETRIEYKDEIRERLEKSLAADIEASGREGKEDMY